ncbi:MAG: hypothetical protein ACR2GX_08325 [Candidatus Dormibacteria bacterium]
MYQPPVPTWVTVGRVLIIVEGALWALLAVLLALAGAFVGSLGNSFPGAGNFASGVTSVFIIVALVILALAVLGIWSGVAIGKLTAGPRITGIVLCSLGLILGVLSLFGNGHVTSETDVNGYTTTSSSGGSSLVFGIILIALNALIIYSWAIDAAARAAFRGRASGANMAGTPMMYGAPPPGTLPPGSGSYGAPQQGYPQQPGYPPQAPPGYGAPQQPDYPNQGPPPPQQWQ